MSTEFETAVETSNQLAKKPTDDELLELYAYYKVGKDEEAKEPGVFDLKGKYKYNKWKKVKDTGISNEEAQQKYVELVEQLKEKYGLKE